MFSSQLRTLRSTLRVALRSPLCTVKEKKSLFSKLSFIGGGKMAEAFICALSTSGLQNMGDVMVNDVNESRLQVLQDKYGVQTTLDVNETVSKEYSWSLIR